MPTITFSGLLGVIAGSAAVYFFFSLIVSGLNEWFARYTHARARALEASMPALLGSNGPTNSLFDAFARHPLIEGLSTDHRFPSYIPSLHVGMVLVELALDVKAGPPPSISVRSHIRRTGIAITKDERAVLSGLVAGETNVRTVQARFEKWFDESAERISGTYKRQTYNSLFGISALITILFGLDSIRMFELLYTSGATAATNLPDKAATLPIGWVFVATGLPTSIRSILGGIVTTFALTLGAPFWFDVLTKYVNLRQTGTPPQDRKQLMG